MNRKSVLGTVLVGGEKEILSILSIDSSIPIILTRGVRDIENQRRVAKRRKRQVGGIYPAGGAGGKPPFVGTVGGCSQASFPRPL